MLIINKNKLSKRPTQLILYWIGWLVAVLISSNSAHAELVLADSDAIKLQLKWLHQFQFAGYYAANQQGFFKQNGLAVTIIEGGPNTLPIQAIHAGTADYGVTGPEILIDHLKTHETVAIAAIFQHSPYALMSLKQSHIVNIKDLIGKRVMLPVPYRSETALNGEQGTDEFKLMLLSEGIDIQQIQLIDQPWNLNDLIDLKVDAIMSYFPAQPNMLKALGHDINLIKNTNHIVDYYGDVLFTTATEASEHPQRVGAFLKSVQQGWKYALSHPEQTADYILTLPGVKERGLTKTILMAEARDMQGLILPDIVEIGHMNSTRWQTIAEAYATLGIIEKKADLSDFIFKPNLDQGLSKLQAIFLSLLLVGILGIFTVWIFNSRRKINSKLVKIDNEIALREEAEANLIQSQQYINQMFRATTLGIAIANKEGHFVLANAAYCKLVDYTESELRTKKFEDLIYREDKEAFRLYFRSTLKNSIHDFTLEKRFMTQLNQQVWLRTSISAMLDVSGEMSHFFIVAENISERMSIQHQFSHNEKLLKIATSVTRVGGWTFDVAKKELVWSDEVNKMRDLPLGTRSSVEEGALFYAPEYQETVLNLFLNCVENGVPYEAETEQITATGRRIWVRTQGEAIRDETGRIVAVQGAYQDISKQKRLEILNERQLEILKNIALGKPLKPILLSLIDMIESQYPDCICSVHLIDKTSTQLKTGISKQLPKSYLTEIGDFEIGEHAGSCGSAAFKAEIVIVDNISNDARWEKCRDIALAHGLQSCWSHPILAQKNKASANQTSGNQVLGTFGIYAKTIHTPSAAEISLVSACADMASIAILHQNHMLKSN